MSLEIGARKFGEGVNRALDGLNGLRIGKEAIQAARGSRPSLPDSATVAKAFEAIANETNKTFVKSGNTVANVPPPNDRVSTSGAQGA